MCVAPLSNSEKICTQICLFLSIDDSSTRVVALQCGHTAYISSLSNSEHTDPCSTDSVWQKLSTMRANNSRNKMQVC